MKQAWQKWIIVWAVAQTLYGSGVLAVSARFQANPAIGEAEFSAFQEWLGRYAAAPTGESKTALEPEGIKLAERRRAALAGLIRSDPERALGLAVSATVRLSLPASVSALLE